ncbi:MAG: hypothetical protein ACXVBC_03855 [Bdellovibrionota bacterium]
MLLTICAMMGMALLTSQLAQASENDLRRNAEIMFREDRDLSHQIDQKMEKIHADEIDRDALRNIGEKSAQDVAKIAELEISIRKGWEEVYVLNMKKLQSSQKFSKAAEAMLKARDLPEMPVFADNRLDSGKLGASGGISGPSRNLAGTGR